MSGLRTARNGEVLRLTLDRPEKRNAIAESDWAELRRVVGELQTSSEVHVVVLQATGSIFSAGVDLDLIAKARSSADGLVRLIRDNGTVVQAFEQLPQIVVVALNGAAIGIAVHFAIAADFVLATQDAYLQLPEAGLGMPDVMHGRLLEQRLGRNKSLAFSLLGERLAVPEAISAGLVYRQYNNTETLDAGLSELLDRLRRITPAVRRQVKRALIDGSRMKGLEMQMRAVKDL